MAKRTEIDHKELKEADAFFEGFGRARRWVEENTRTVLGIVVGVAVLFVAGVSWSAYSQNRADGTAAAFLRATDAMGLDSVETAKAALQNVSERSGGTYGQLATLYEADVTAREGGCEEAIGGYREVQNNSREGFVRQVAAMGVAFCLEQTDKPEEATGVYSQAAEMQGPYREQALRGQLRSALLASNDEVAAAAIELILEDYPESPDAEELSQKLTALGG